MARFEPTEERRGRFEAESIRPGHDTGTPSDEVYGMKHFLRKLQEGGSHFPEQVVHISRSRWFTFPGAGGSHFPSKFTLVLHSLSELSQEYQGNTTTCLRHRLMNFICRHVRVRMWCHLCSQRCHGQIQCDHGGD
ncbi:hypothetical protein RRG08_066345 [Elysia crispata]|uniref:Uncharacterized protein n=1 Tax=Elysia crispata TaxID=231223 RepID=A0AAE1CUM2_9GAST|nr:hypothetical protein RRG08_066345 [Elysia crispata]